MAKRKKGEGVGVLELLAMMILVLAAIFAIFILVLGPEIYSRLSAYLATVYLEEQQGQKPPPPPPEDPDFSRYFELKAKSCQILSKDFLIVTQDQSYGRTAGLLELPGQAEAAEHILSQYQFNQTTKTYLKRDWLKKVVETGSENFTSIWKEGTLYECASGGCSMTHLGESGWQAHLDSITRMRTGCAHFGRTKMPDSVNMSRLLKVERDGYATLRGNRCERFLISGERNYSESLLNSGQMNPDQEAVLWALTHLNGPVEECLDEGTGIVVSRRLSLDLTPTYRLDYSPGGFMRVDQSTDLTFYSSSVPDSFFALPS